MIRTITLLLLFSFSFVAAEAQYGKKKPRPRSEKEKIEQKAKDKEEKVEEKDESSYEPSEDDDIDTQGSGVSSAFWNKIWYGAGAQLNFGASQGGRTFAIGLSPMAAYKFSDHFSAGPRFDIQYRSFRIQTGFDEFESTSALEKGLGVFSRLKIANIAFIHAEYQHLFGKDFFQNGFSGELFTEPFNQNLILLGAGLYQGDGEWSYNFYITVDVLQERPTVDFPVYFRAEIARFF